MKKLCIILICPVCVGPNEVLGEIIVKYFPASLFAAVARKRIALEAGRETKHRNSALKLPWYLAISELEV